jgi:hypothetical protein
MDSLKPQEWLLDNRYDEAAGSPLPRYNPPCQYPVRHLPWAIKSTKVGAVHDPIDEDFHDGKL